MHPLALVSSHIEHTPVYKVRINPLGFHMPVIKVCQSFYVFILNPVLTLIIKTDGPEPNYSLVDCTAEGQQGGIVSSNTSGSWPQHRPVHVQAAMSATSHISLFRDESNITNRNIKAVFCWLVSTLSSFIGRNTSYFRHGVEFLAMGSYR